MKLIDLLLKIAGKESFEIDKRISKKYLISCCLKYGMMIFRGRIFSACFPLIDHSVFVGKKVKVIEKRQLSVGTKSKIHEGVYIDALSTDGVHLGSNVVLGRNTRIECTGTISSLGKGISIGEHTTFGNDCFFGAAGGIIIGNDVIGGQYVRFHSENHNYRDHSKLIREQGVSRKGIRIGNNCWIGAGAVFLDGAELGNGCVVAANAVVTKKFADNSIVGGVPAKLIKER